ncbi:MAG: hypothetical protein ACU843_09365 [Gammaproteobacteria bacterium]
MAARRLRLARLVFETLRFQCESELTLRATRSSDGFRVLCRADVTMGCFDLLPAVVPGRHNSKARIADTATPIPVLCILDFMESSIEWLKSLIKKSLVLIEIHARNSGSPFSAVEWGIQ